MTDALARPQSLNRYAYVVDSPATFADPSGNFIVWQGCFLDALLPECQCDPENGCPPNLLLPPPVLGLVAVVTLRSLRGPRECSKQEPHNNEDCASCCGRAALIDAGICLAGGLIEPAFGAACAALAIALDEECLDCCKQVAETGEPRKLVSRWRGGPRPSAAWLVACLSVVGRS